MSADVRKGEIITFKADRPLLEALERVPNRSEFIRSAILAALEDVCPLCRGRGTLSAAQQNHWQAFATHHGVEQCDDCHEIHLVCDASLPHAVHKRGAQRR